MLTRHARLKLLTQPCHDMIEQNRFAHELLGAFTPLPLYKEFLQKLWGFIAPLETVLYSDSHFSNHSLVRHVVRKSELLHEDLHYFNVRYDEQYSVCKKLPHLSTLYHKIGALYVLEGSMIGAFQQAKILRRNLGIDEYTGLRYMTGYSIETFSHWERFTVALNTLECHPHDDNEIILGAIETFLTLHNWFALK